MLTLGPALQYFCALDNLKNVQSISTNLPYSTKN